VRDPAREEHTRRRPARRHAGVHAHVIDRHQDHHDAANDVDRLDPLFVRHA
jgi:hypothetical protein